MLLLIDKIKTYLRVFFKNTKGDRLIWLSVILMFMVSLLVVYSASSNLMIHTGYSNSLLLKQFFIIGVGFVSIYIAHKIDYMFYFKIANMLYFITIALLIYTMIFGVTINAGTRWIKIPILNLTFQTSDLAKLTLIIMMAKLLSKSQEYIHDFKKSFLPIMGIVLLLATLIAPSNLSTAILFVITGLIMCFLGRASLKHLSLTIMAIAVVPAIILISCAYLTFDFKADTNKPLPTVLKIYRLPIWIYRTQDFLFKKNDHINYQTQQSNIAIANGGLIGVGPGNSEQRYFLPLAYSDFIYAIIIEEYGLMGCIILICIYLFFFYRCIKIFRAHPYSFAAFLSLGLGIMITLQAFLNMSVNVGILPVTGVTLPLISMGGTSYLFYCFSIGIILSIARNVEVIKKDKQKLSTVVL